VEHRIRAALLLYAFFVLGLFLLVSPWTVVWSRAVVGLLPTPFGGIARSGWLRGLVSGLGALNLMLALELAIDVSRGTRRE
jgi:hypothetical protein